MVEVGQHYQLKDASTTIKIEQITDRHILYSFDDADVRRKRIYPIVKELQEAEIENGDLILVA